MENTKRRDDPFLKDVDTARSISAGSREHASRILMRKLWV